MDALRNLSTRTWALIGGGIALAVVVFFIISSIAGQTSYTPLASNLDVQQSVKLTQALAAQKIPYQTGNGGSSVSVETSQLSKAQALLVTNGYGAKAGWTLFDKMPLGSTELQQQVDLQRAMQDEIAMSLENIDGIQSASVQLAIPQKSIYTSEQEPTTASVMVNTGGTPLDPRVVASMAQFVASAVPGLKSSNVSITDESGNLLTSPSSSGSDGGLLGSPTKVQAEQNFDQSEQSRLTALLANIAGPGKVAVQVTADLKWDDQKVQQETWGNKSQPLQQSKSGETFTGNGSTAAGIPGTGSNIPSYGQSNSSGKTGSNYKQAQSNTTYAIDKTLTTTDVAKGGLNKQAVSVLVDSTVPASVFRAIQSATAAAIGYNAARGDQLSVNRVPFAKTATTTTAAPTGGMAKYLSLAKEGGLILLAILFLFFLWRSLRKRERDVMKINTSALPAGDTLRAPTVALPKADEPAMPPLPRPALSREEQAALDLRNEVERLANEKPRESAAALTQWLNEIQ